MSMDQQYDDRLVKDIIRDEQSPTTIDPTRVTGFDPSALRPRPNTSLGLVPSRAPEVGAAGVGAGGAYAGISDMPVPELQPNDVRLQPGYAEWYYAQNPRDPRFPPPLTTFPRFSATQRQATPPPDPSRPAPGPFSSPPTGTDDAGYGYRQIAPSREQQAQQAAMAAHQQAAQQQQQQQQMHQQILQQLQLTQLTQQLQAQQQAQQLVQMAQQQQHQPGGPQGAPLSPDSLTMAAYALAANPLLQALSPLSGGRQATGGAPTGQAAGGGGGVPSGIDPQQLLALLQQQQQIQAAMSLASQLNPAVAMQYAAQLAWYTPQLMQQQQAVQQLYGQAIFSGAQGVSSPSAMAFSQGPLQSYAQQQERLEFEQLQQAYGGGGGMGGAPGMMGGGGPGRGRGGRGGRGGTPWEEGGRGGGRGGRGRGGPSSGGMMGAGGAGGMSAGGGPAAAPRNRSPFLDAFRQNVATWTLLDVVGNVDELARDQEGSRFIQRMLEEPDANPEHIKGLFAEVLANPLGLLTDVFGNYVVQKMLEVATPEQATDFAKAMQTHVVELTLQTYGCRVVQKAIQVFRGADRAAIVSELRAHVAMCVQDQNGNHVIQKCIEELPEDSDFVLQTFLGRVPEFATHAYGCRVIQCILVHCPKYHGYIIPEILSHADALCCDQFGNYVVQHLINDVPDVLPALVAALESKFYYYSVHKFASNVMEKLYQQLHPEQQARILASLMANIERDGRSQLVTMMSDQFGNYVVQRVLEAATEEQRKEIVEHVKPQVHALRRFTFGKHIVARLERMVQQSLTGHGPPGSIDAASAAAAGGGGGGHAGAYGGSGGGHHRGGRGMGAR